MLAGTAMDYRVRAYFERNIHRARAVVRGLTLLSSLVNLEKHVETWTEVTENPWYHGRKKHIADRFVESFEAFISTAAPERRQLLAAEEEKLCRYCVVFAYLDFIGRAPGRNSAIEIMVQLGRPDIDDMLRYLDERVVADLVHLSGRFYEQQGLLLSTFAHAVTGGTLAGSADIGGADFDLVVDGCLIDLKVSVKRNITTAYLRQLVGYWLLDYEDSLSIRSVAILLLRHGHTHRFEMAELLPPGGTAPELRRAFREGLEQDAAAAGGRREA